MYEDGTYKGGHYFDDEFLHDTEYWEYGSWYV